MTGLEFLLICMAAVNGWAFLMYAYDKHRAQENAWRVPENTLLIIAFLGPFGAYAAMRLFRHKTRKLKYYLVPVFLILQFAAILWFMVFRH
jgi:uncharacterized membrane protein YsdA (DUF1294 family)